MKPIRMPTEEAVRIVEEHGFRASHKGGYVTAHREERDANYKASSRRACAHEYSVLIEAILTAYPEAGVVTQIAIYRGLEDFLARKEQTLALALAVYPCQAEH